MLDTTKGLLRLVKRGGALDSSGWLTSLKHGFPCDRDGNPVPWIASPAVHFLASRVETSFSVFEFGSGYSTMWWGQHAGRVTSCEHDAQWAAIVKAKVPGNVRVLETPLDDEYPATIARTGQTFDIVVVDGRKRVSSALNARKCLNEGGVIVWDDSERERYQDGVRSLLSDGFRKLDFVGLSPLVSKLKQTSVFYRDHNCLGI